MGIRPDDFEKTKVRALRRRHALLAAYLEVLNRLDDRSHRRVPECLHEQRPRREIHSLRAARIAALTRRLEARTRLSQTEWP